MNSVAPVLARKRAESSDLHGTFQRQNSPCMTEFEPMAGFSRLFTRMDRTSHGNRLILLAELANLS